jgi:hypothetical protein
LSFGKFLVLTQKCFRLLIGPGLRRMTSMPATTYGLRAIGAAEYPTTDRTFLIDRAPPIYRQEHAIFPDSDIPAGVIRRFYFDWRNAV